MEKLTVSGPGRPVLSRHGRRAPLPGRRIWHVRCPRCGVPGVVERSMRFTCKITSCGEMATVVHREGE